MADALHLELNPGFNLGGSGTATNFGVAASNSQVEFIFAADQAVAITKLGFRYGARTGTPPIYKISLQGVDATTGFPDGTIKGGGSPASVSFTPPADATWDGTWRELTLDNSYTCTRGEILAIVISYVSGAIDASNTSSFSVSDGYSLYAAIEGFPYAIQNAAGVRTKSSSRPVFSYVAGTTVFGFPSLTAFTSAGFTSATNPNEAGFAFTLPAGWGSTFKISGVRFRANVPAATKTLKVQLYTGTTVLQTMTFDSDIVQAQNNRVFLAQFTETTLATLTFGQQYRIGFAPQDAAGNWTFSGLTLNSNADWAAYPLGVNCFHSTRNGAAWTDVPATRLNASLFLADITPPAGVPGIIMATG